MALIKVLYVPADWQQPTEVREVSSRDLKAFQGMVCGYVEQVTFMSPFVVGLFNEEADRLKLDLNARASIYLAQRFQANNWGLGFRGNVVFVSQEDDNWGDVNQDVTKWFDKAAEVARQPLS